MQEVNCTSADAIIHRDDVYFNEALVSAFIQGAKKKNKPARLAFLDIDTSITKHAQYPRATLEHVGNLYLGQLYYVPAGARAQDFVSVVIDTESIALPCFSLPSPDPNTCGVFGAPISSGIISFPPLQLWVPLRAYVEIKHWVQLLFANFIWGIHCEARQLDVRLKSRDKADAKKASRYMLNRRGLVRVGANCQIDPTATIIGPTIIGDGVVIGPNATIAAAHIGNHAILEPHCSIWLGVLGERSSLLAHNTIVMSCVMSDSIINTHVRFSMVGNESFVAGGAHFTDRLLNEVHNGDPQMKAPMVKVFADGELVDSGYYVLGPCLGNRVRIGSGIIIYPGRVVQSGSLLIAKESNQHIVDK
jgi:acetyltransferase-like isoleucine patch superfamily enzyme